MELKEAKKLLMEVKGIIEPIKATEFITIKFSDEINKKCCVIGHYNRIMNGDVDNYAHDNCCYLKDYERGFREEEPIREASRLFLDKLHNYIGDISDVNNGNDSYSINFKKKITKFYPQKTPKGRVMAFLRKVENYIIKK